MLRIVKVAMLFGVLIVSALAQAAKEYAHINVTLHSTSGLDGKSVMISILKDGKIVKQGEITVPSAGKYDSKLFVGLEPGQYDVRLEGENMQTVVKQGINAIPLGIDLSQRMEQGSGLLRRSPTPTLESLKN